MASSGKRVYAALATIFLVVGGAFGYAPRPAVFSVLCAAAPPREICSAVSGGIAETYTNYIDGTLLGVQVAGNGVVPDHNIALPQNISSGQPLGFTLTQGGATRSAAVSYDGSGKVLNLTDGAVSANYLWTPGGHATGIVVNVAGAARLSLASAWNEALSVRSNMTFTAGGATVASFAFQRGNGTSQITRIVREDGTSREISYDGSGRLAGWKHKNAAGVADYDRSWVFGYDGANNLVSAGRDPTVAGGPLPMSPMCKQYATQNIRSNSQFSVDAFNFSAVRNWRAVDLVCYAVTNARVTVNGMAARRNGTRFVVSIPLAQNSAASVTNLTVCAVTSAGTNLEYYTTNTVTLQLPANPETIQTALASAVTADSVMSYQYDARDQLRQVTDQPGATAQRLQSTYYYYPDGRRAEKIVTYWNGSSWQPYRTCQYIYNQWNLIREIVSNQTGVVTRDFSWGLDLQGIGDGQWGQQSGGIGGLLAITEVSGSKTNIFLPVCDHVGTVHALVAAVTNNVTLSTPAIVATYEYSPYGELIAQDGPYAGSSPLGFMSKYRDQETGLVYFGYRYLNAKTYSWMTSDTLGEAGGLNLVEAFASDPVNKVDCKGEAAQDNTTANETGSASLTLDIIFKPKPVQTEITAGTGTGVPVFDARGEMSQWWRDAPAFLSDLKEASLNAAYNLHHGNYRAAGLYGAGVTLDVASDMALIFGPEAKAEVKVGVTAIERAAEKAAIKAVVEKAGKSVMDGVVKEVSAITERNAVIRALDTQAAKSTLATATDEAVFWSGLARGGDVQAANWVARHGGSTLETTLATRGIKLPVWDANNPASVAAWRNAATEFAVGARGNVRVLQGDVLRVDAIWRDEFKALQINPNVNSIRAINPNTGMEVPLWAR